MTIIALTGTDQPKGKDMFVLRRTSVARSTMSGAKEGRPKVSWHTFILVRMAVLAVAGLTLATLTAQQGASSSLAGVNLQTGGSSVGQSVAIERVASFRGCSWTGVCSVALNRAETTAVAAGSSVYIGILNIHVGAAYAAAAAYAIERGYCLQLNWQVARGAAGLRWSLARC